MGWGSTHFPGPEPPTIPMISFGRTSKARPSCTTCLPKRVTRPSTRMISLSPAALWMDEAISEADLHEQDGEQRVGEYHQENGLHHGGGRQSAELARGIPHLHAAIRPDHADEQREYRSLDQA